ncbi:MAG: RNA methyltransferase [Candidatus Zixiibacteriota bacterium]|nr:MAG: RNA methyltransferase [candidate division Zixibacteria bacterium]
MSITQAELKEVKSLATGKGRKATGLFAAEGVRLLEEAVRNRFWPRRVYCAGSMLSDRGSKLIDYLTGKKIDCRDISARQLRAMATTKTPQGIVAVFDLPQDRLSELYRRKHRRLLWCENVSDPGNLGTLARSASAFGFDPMIVSGSSADIYSPRVVRSSAGSVFALAIARADNREIIELAGERGIAIVAAGVDSKNFDYSLKKMFELDKLILAVGGEADGLSPEIIENADIRVRIAHSPGVESLNVAVAGSILMEKLYGCHEVTS